MPSSQANGTSNWPPRRNPLPSTFFEQHSSTIGPLARRRNGDNNRLSKLADAPADLSWDTDTISAHSQSPRSRASSYDSADESLPELYPREHRRAITTLGRRLKCREFDIERLQEQVEDLRVQADDSQRQSISERQATLKQSELVEWLEQQLSEKCDEISQLEATHKLALRSMESRHARAIERLMIRASDAEDEAMQLGLHVKNLTRDLERAQAAEEKCRIECRRLMACLQDARLAVAQAGGVSSELQERLQERAQYVGELEQQIRDLLGLVSAPHDPSRAYGTDAVSVSGISLFAEMEQATGAAGGQLDLLSSFEAAESPVAMQSAASAIAANIEQSGALVLGAPSGAKSVSSMSLRGAVYWVAVYLHMLYSLMNPRMWICAIWRLMCLVVGMVLGSLTSRPVGRLLMLVLLSPFSLTKGLLGGYRK
ncbi:hypothetical protein GGI07_000644 [Coemansia sp. Benny D115]|nr:hypothetical protein GGI07_000644 [Coemansia sp. Benny D115]